MKSKAVVLIPVYKPTPDRLELISLQRCFEVFGNHSICLAAPEGLDTSAYHLEQGKLEVISFAPEYFATVKGYSKLLTRPFFYQRFLAYDYMLIHQLDVFVFRDELSIWCEKGYDYIGAPWMDKAWMKELEHKWKIPFISHFFRKAGNGGFSLRNVRAFYRAARLFEPATSRMRLNEDIIWANNPLSFTPFFKVAGFRDSLRFAFETAPEKCYELNEHQLPFGTHAWQKHNPRFWIPFFKDCGYDISFLT